MTIRELGLGAPALEQQLLRTVFNVIARNQDDHVKNIAFLMDRAGEWPLSPAFDMNYSYNPSDDWTGQHQMSLNGKRDGFAMDDLLAFAETASIKPAKAKTFISNVGEAVSNWPQYAENAGVDDATTQRIGNAHQLSLGSKMQECGSFGAFFAAPPVNWYLPRPDRGGTVCLNSSGRFAKWISAWIMPPPSSASAR
nr:HipA domain-containing protein [Roseibium litorale]